MVDAARDSRGLLRRATLRGFSRRTGHLEERAEPAAGALGGARGVRACGRRRARDAVRVRADPARQGPGHRDDRASAVGRPVGVWKGQRAAEGDRPQDRSAGGEAAGVRRGRRAAAAGGVRVRGRAGGERGDARAVGEAGEGLRLSPSDRGSPNLGPPRPSSRQMGSTHRPPTRMHCRRTLRN